MFYVSLVLSYFSSHYSLSYTFCTVPYTHCPTLSVLYHILTVLHFLYPILTVLHFCSHYFLSYTSSTLPYTHSSAHPVLYLILTHLYHYTTSHHYTNHPGNNTTQTNTCHHLNPLPTLQPPEVATQTNLKLITLPCLSHTNFHSQIAKGSTRN